MKHRIEKRDLWWMLALPIYQMVGTFRHEASHATIALLEGAVVTEFVVWPTMPQGRLLWGYVRWDRDVSLLATAAPYLFDLVTFVAIYFVCTQTRLRRWIWFNLVIVGAASPLINSAYNYINGVLPGRTNDVAGLLQELPDALVHSYFILTLFVYSLGLYNILKPRGEISSSK